MFKIKIRGDRWTVFAFEHDEFVRRFGGDMAAFTDASNRQIFFNVDDTDLETCRHEVFHAFATYPSSVGPSNVNSLNEEHWAETFCRYAVPMMSLARSILRRIRRLEG